MEAAEAGVLIHAAYAEGRRPDDRGVRFCFEEESLSGRIGALARRFAQNRRKNGADAPALVDVARGDRIFTRISPEGAASFCFRTETGSGGFVSVIVGAPRRLVRLRQVPFAIGAPVARRPVYGRYMDLAVGDLHFLYIPPDSLVHRSLREDLNVLLHRMTVHLVLIDEAHAMSEWSQAFDPSCLRITSLIEYLSVQSPELSVIALSHAAPPMVRRDIVSALDLRDVTPAAPQNFYRENIRFEAHATEDPAEKARILEGIMAEDAGAADGTFDPPVATPVEDAAVRFSMRTRAVERDASAVCIRITDGLDGSPEDYLLGAVHAADRRPEVRSVLLAEPPNAACAADMRRRLSWAPGCMSGPCPFGKTAICDYGRRSLSIDRLRPDPETAASAVLKALDALIAGVEAGESPVRIPLTPEDRKQTELALWRLSMIGVLELYFIDAREDPPAFKVYGFNSRLNDEAAMAAIFAYLQKCAASAARTVSADEIARQVKKNQTVDWYRSRHGDAMDRCVRAAVQAGGLRGFAAHERFYRETLDYLLPFICRVADDLKEMAFQTLWRFNEFLHGASCRYAALLQRTRAADETWTCGRCDRCAPAPPREAASGALNAPDAADDLDVRLREWLDAGDAAVDWRRAEEFVQAGGEKRRTLLRRACRAAEETPRHIRALYLIAALSDDVFKGRHYMALIRAAGRKMTPAGICRLYESLNADPDIRKMMFDLLDDAHGALNRRTGEEWLYREAKNLDLDDRTLDFLGARVVLNEIARADLKPVNEAITRLIEEM